MFRYFGILLAMFSFSASPALRAASKPHAVPAPAKATWTNEDLEGLSRIPGLISMVGQTTSEELQDASSAGSKKAAQDPAWYKAQAASLRTRLAAEQANLGDFTRAVDDARELRSMTAGIDLPGDDIGITPEDSIAILQNRVRDTQSELEALEDLARHNDIPPGTLRD
jgi:hypothetical protein